MRCGKPICWVAIDFNVNLTAETGDGPVRCCRKFIPLSLCRLEVEKTVINLPHLDLATSCSGGESKGDQDSEEEAWWEDNFFEDNDDILPVGLVHIAVFNRNLFLSEPSVVIDFDTEIDASKELRETIDNASDGDTIGVCDSLTTECL